MVIGLIIGIIWLIFGIITYIIFDKKSKKSVLEKIWFSCLWPCTWILYVLYVIRCKIQDYMR